MEEARRVAIVCAGPASIREIKKHYNYYENDEEHYFYNYNDALEFLIFGKIIGTPPQLIVADLEAKKCKGQLLFLKVKEIAPEATILGINPSKRNEP